MWILRIKKIKSFIKQAGVDDREKCVLKIKKFIFEEIFMLKK
jgi:hypothetical protein